MFELDDEWKIVNNVFVNKCFWLLPWLDKRKGFGKTHLLWKCLSDSGQIDNFNRPWNCQQILKKLQESRNGYASVGRFYF